MDINGSKKEEDIMQTITIAERLWLEPTLLGATLNYADQATGWQYRVGIGFRSLEECDKTLDKGGRWTLRDQSLTIEGTEQLTLTFCPGSEMEQRLVLTGEELETFRSAIHFLTLASEPRQN
jgi:hypothetical protein